MTEPDVGANTRPPLHRLASRCALATLGGALGAAGAVGLVQLTDLSISAAERVGYAAGFGVVAVAVLAPLEAVASFARRRGPRAAALVALVPPLGLLLILAAGAWIQALRGVGPGDLAARWADAFARLAQTPALLKGLALLAAFVVPLALARALEARPLRACALLVAWALLVWFVVFTYAVRPPRRPDFLEWALPIAAITAAVSLGLHLGDRLEPRLADGLRRRLHGPDPSGASE